MPRLMRFPTATPREPAIDAWFDQREGELGAAARRWFEVARRCGEDVRELLHDGQPTACVEDAAFAYVAVYTAHAAVGFYLGAGLSDPAGLLEGTGRFMRHVKLRPGDDVDPEALETLLQLAYADMKRHIARSPSSAHP